RDEDARLALALAELEPDRDLARLVDEHWRLVGKRPELAARFTEQERGARSRSEAIVDAIESVRGRPIGPGDRALEVGCGTAALSAALVRRGAAAVASDVSRRWLALARKRLTAEAQADVELVACAGEALPFADGSFELVTA